MTIIHVSSISGHRKNKWAKATKNARRPVCSITTIIAAAACACAMVLLVLYAKASAPYVGSKIRGGASGGDNNIGDTDNTRTSQNKSSNDDADGVVILSLELDDKDEENNARTENMRIVDIRMRLYDREAPEAARYVKELASNANQQCRKCTLYRGEPVPKYWGSGDYPDRYFDGGRWGPPYALVQGGLLADGDGHPTGGDVGALVPPLPPAEPHKPVIERGMVAWAGGKGGPHFFIALAEHPEWGHGHTVFAKVIGEEDMAKVDALLSRPLVSTKPKRPPIVSNFVDPIPFRIRMGV
jgi:cyclophilin family peptidyl-prolyl cis-trans isomerase